MAEIILRSNHPDYCDECVYHGSEFGNCLNEDYKKNSYKVNCVWHYYPYKQMERLTVEDDGHYVPRMLCSVDRFGGIDDRDSCAEYCGEVRSCENGG